MRRYVALHPELVRSEQIRSEISIKPFRNEILEYLQSLEGSCTTLNSSMIDNQPEINWSMRPYIVDFMMELHLFFKLSQETFFLACFIADKYCCKRIVYKRHYQLLAATSLWTAAKYQDKKTRVPTLRELVLLCHRIYEPKMFVQMERHVLTTLEWSVGSFTTTFDVVQWIIATSSVKTIPQTPEFLLLTSFLCDLTLYQREFMDYSSSVKGISVLLLACKIVRNDSFSNFLNQLIDSKIQWGQFDKNNDLCFHIAGDSLTNDLSLSLNEVNLHPIRECLYYLIREISSDEICDNSMVNQRIILKKYRRLPVANWLDNFRRENFEIISQLISLSNSLNLATKTPYPDTMKDWILDSILNYVDKLIGLQKDSGSMEQDELIFDDDFSHSSPYLNDFTLSQSACIEGTTQLMSSASSIPNPPTPNTYKNFNHNGTVRHTSLGSVQGSQYCPPTPYSANSTFSNRQPLSTGSSISSVSSKSSASPAFFFKKPLRSNTRHSSGNNQLVILKEPSNQDDLFE